MNNKVKLLLLAVVFSALIVGGTTGFAAEGDKDAFKAIVTIPPQEFLVKEIAGDRFAVSSMVPEDGSPHSASVTPGKLRKIRNSDIYLKVGTPISFEVNNVPVFRQENPDLLVKDISIGIELKSLDEHYGKSDVAGSSNDKNKAVDNHIWLSPANLKEMAKNVKNALREVDPAYADRYKKNFESLLARISEAQAEINRLIADYKGRSFLAYHPAWGYFGDEFQLRQIVVQEGGDRPGPRRIREITEYAREHGIRAIIASAQFNPSTARMVAGSFGGEVITINPMEEEILEEIVELAKAISRGYSES